MPDRQSKEDIFFAALEQPTAQAQADFLAEACAGNAELRRQVDRLLASHQRVGGFLERPVQEAADLVGGGATPPADDTDGGRRGDGNPLDFLTPSSRPDSLGRIGHYEVLQVLGQGGMGVVVRAFDEKLHRVVAIKALAPALAAVGPARRRFVREARSAASVIHDHVVAVHAVADDGPVPYLVMQCVNGPTLQQKIDRGGPLPVVEVLRLGMQVASGLAAAHAQGLVHRDVKPSNILLENGVERVKITDFGLARTTDEPSVTTPGVIAGTPAYMSPEQAAGEAVDHRSDLFSLGSVLYAMCAGDSPFRAPTMVGVLKRVCENTPRPVRELNPEIPAWLEELIARLHAKSPADRPGGAAAVAEELGQRLAELQQPTRLAAPRPAGRTASRWLAAVAAAVLLAVGLGATEATGVTNVRGAVVRLVRPDGTLVVEVDDPAVSVSVEGTDVVITGAGAKEIRLKPGDYQVKASKDGQVVRQELVSVSRDGRQVVRISKEAAPAKAPPEDEAAAWEKSVTALPANKQAQAVADRLKERNPGFDGRVYPNVENREVVGLRFATTDVTDITPVRALPNLRWLDCNVQPWGSRGGKLTDLTPLRGLKLEHVRVQGNPVSNLEPLRGMRLEILDCGWTQVGDLSPLTGMKLKQLRIQDTRVSDLSPLVGMPLTSLDMHGARNVTDISPIQGMPLVYLNLSGLSISDLSQVGKYTSLWTLILDETPVTDLTPLRNLKIEILSLRNTPVTDFDPIKRLPLKRLRFDYRPDRKGLLQSFPGLERINEQSPAEFWQRVGGK